MTAKNKGGRPRKVLTDDDWAKLIAMIRIQCTQAEICGIFGMDSNTLDRIIKERGHKGFSDLFKKHGDEGKASLRRAQWKAATEDHNPTMLIWLGKQVLGQRDKTEHSGPDGGPIQHRRLTLEEARSEAVARGLPPHIFDE